MCELVGVRFVNSMLVKRKLCRPDLAACLFTARSVWFRCLRKGLLMELAQLYGYLKEITETSEGPERESLVRQLAANPALVVLERCIDQQARCEQSLSDRR